MIYLRLLLIVSLSLLSGCASFVAVPPGESTHTGMTVTTGTTWNQLPANATFSSRVNTRQWTLDGLLLDRLILIPAIPPGEAVFRQQAGNDSLPLFSADMLPHEIQELVESSIVRLFGEGGAVVETSGLRPQRFGQDKGILFDLAVSVSDGPDYRGVTGALVVDDKLYLIVYLAVKTYYYDKHLNEALGVIKSLRVDGENGTVGIGDSAFPFAATNASDKVSGIYVSEIVTGSRRQL